MKIGNQEIGTGHTYVISEIGINHNGSVDIAKRLIDVAKEAGCDAVKFQKRTPELCVPPEQRDIMRYGTPWGDVTYMQYRIEVEFDKADYKAIAKHCEKVGIAWFASCWDVPSVEFIEQFDPPCHKVASACITDTELLTTLADTGKVLLLSTGMSTQRQVDDAVAMILRKDNEFASLPPLTQLAERQAGNHKDTDLVVMQSVSSYPALYEHLNLRAIPWLRERYGTLVGYSGHETGIASTVAAAALGACVVERHITLDRAMWGSDQAASLGPEGIRHLVRDIRIVEQALGQPGKELLPCELPSLKKLRVAK